MTTNDNFLTILESIEENLSKSLNTTELARISYRSVMQLYRDFYNITGYPIKEYIRRRRLSKALTLVKYSNLPLSEIAYELGYSSQQAFCKSVKSATHLTPMEYKSAELHYYFPKYLGNLNLQISVSTLTIPETISFSYYSSKSEDIETNALTAFSALLPEYQGRIFGHNAEGKDCLYCYELLLETSALTSAQTRLLTQYTNNSHILPAFTSLFATTITNNQKEQIIDAWNCLYNSWMYRSMFRQSDVPFFEEYFSRNKTHPKLMLYLPIEKKVTPYTIQIQDKPAFTVLISSKIQISSNDNSHAEEEASLEVVDFLQAHYPYLLKRTKTLFTRQLASRFSCGILLEAPIPIPTDCKMSIEAIPKGCYASITLNQCSDPSILQAILTSWLTENGFKAEEEVSFFLYTLPSGSSTGDYDTTYYIKLISNSTSVESKML